MTADRLQGPWFVVAPPSEETRKKRQAVYARFGLYTCEPVLMQR